MSVSVRNMTIKAVVGNAFILFYMVLAFSLHTVNIQYKESSITQLLLQVCLVEMELNTNAL